MTVSLGNYHAKLFSFHTVWSKIIFNMNDTAYIHQNYTASCTMTAKPRMNLYIYTQGCDFKSETLWIDEYTTKAIITIYNITSDCRKITCATNLSQRSKIVGKELDHILSLVN